MSGGLLRLRQCLRASKLRFAVLLKEMFWQAIARKCILLLGQYHRVNHEDDAIQGPIRLDSSTDQ
jgi:hypothetical protein